MPTTSGARKWPVILEFELQDQRRAKGVQQKTSREMKIREIALLQAIAYVRTISSHSHIEISHQQPSGLVSGCAAALDERQHTAAARPS